MSVACVFLVLPVVAKIFPQVIPWLMGFPREVGRSGSAVEKDTNFAKTCFETAVGEWSARTGKHPGSLLVFLALWCFDSSAHNRSGVGSSPASATNNAHRFRYRRRKVRNYNGFGLFLYKFLRLKYIDILLRKRLSGRT